ncbi:MAG: hypothetical protein HDT22_09070 [Ruminococcus sp.]|nr:hypothetical protein [Ruminococcus sp.]
MAKKKKGSAGVLILLIIILILVVVIFLLLNNNLGLGFENGFGTNLDNNNSEENISDIVENSENAEINTETEFSEIITESNTEILILNITVMGNVYFYQNQEMILENLLSEIQAQENDFMLSITDENATQNAMEDLLTALEHANITYAIDN